MKQYGNKGTVIEKITITNTVDDIKLIKCITSATNRAISSGDIYKALKKKDVRVNGVKIKNDQTLQKEDVIEIFLPEMPGKPEAAKSGKYTIIYQDENFIVVDKKQGLAVHADKNADEENLIDEIRKKIKSDFSPTLCHRIDRNTGGLVIIALNEQALKEITKAILDKRIKKTYHAIVCGKIPSKKGTLVNFLSKNERIGQVFVHEKKEQGDVTAITHYKVLKSQGEVSLLELELETGRTHQIRVQTSHAGFPIIGDGKYGNTNINRKYKTKMQCLFAVKLEFTFDKKSCLSYIDGEKIEIDSGLEKIFEKLTVTTE